MMEATVFYAWQNDTPTAVNRSLVRKATQDAIKRISSDAALEDAVRLDQDTKDVPGTPPVAETIFGKIRQCAVFLADVTLVGWIDSHDASGKAKATPNPNVMIELGYAAATVGWEHTILVMNTAYGTPENLPFDLRHRRWPIGFRAEVGVALDSVRSTLSKKIEDALRLFLPLRPATEGPVVPQKVRQQTEAFHADVKAGRFVGVNAGHGVLMTCFLPTVARWLP